MEEILPRSFKSLSKSLKTATQNKETAFKLKAYSNNYLIAYYMGLKIKHYGHNKNTKGKSRRAYQ